MTAGGATAETPRRRKFHGRRLAVLFLLGILTAPPASTLEARSVAEAPAEYEVKAVFLYNFTRYLQWPAESGAQAFEIAVLGESPILLPLVEIARKRTVGPLPIVVRSCSEVGQIGRPRILFIAEPASRWLPKVLEKIRKTGVLTVTEKEGLAASGAAVNFVLRDGAVKFEMSEAAMQEAHIQVGSQLLKLAIRINRAESGGRP